LTFKAASDRTFHTPRKQGDSDANFKRLESGSFQSSSASKDQARMEIDVTQLSLILHGIDLATAKRRKRYRKAS
jgi:hypothetical protein